MEKKAKELSAKITEMKSKIQEMVEEQAKLKENSTEYQTIMELDKIILESKETLKDLEEKFSHAEDEKKDYHWDDLEKNIYQSSDSFHNTFRKAGTLFKRIK